VACGAGLFSVGLADLTPAEIAALDAAAAGETAPAHARRVGLSPWTIQTYRKHIRQKLGAHTMAQAVQIVGDARLAELASTIEDAPSPRQISCFHARAEQLDQMSKCPPGESKRLALAAASAEFEREFSSVKELSYSQVSWAIDYVTERLRSVPA
jgi:DNA-binding CsgD family transcriptional regulator